MTSPLYSSDWLWLKLLCLTLIATLWFEHSHIDVFISNLFYTNGQWLLQKGAQPYAFTFYDLPKALLIVLGIYLIAVLIIRKISKQKYQQAPLFATASTNSNFIKLIHTLSNREISYLLTVLIIVPTTIALLKGITHVSCPNHLTLFGGELPYLTIWQDIIAKTPVKCFPAAHASAGFSLYGLVFLPSFRQYRYRLFEIISAIGWIMGGYKMLFGDHFFSHTLVSMLLSLTIACGLSVLFFMALNNSKPL